MQANAPILSWIQLHTHQVSASTVDPPCYHSSLARHYVLYITSCLLPQAYFLRAASELICHHLYTQQHATPPQANPRLAGKPFNPLVDFLNIELFGVKTFTSVEK